MSPPEGFKLGDEVAFRLAKIGITKERYTEWMTFVGLMQPGQQCNCPWRMEKLNQISDGVKNAWQTLMSRGG